MELFIKLNKIKCCRFYFSCRLLNIAQNVKKREQTTFAPAGFPLLCKTVFRYRTECLPRPQHRGREGGMIGAIGEKLRFQAEALPRAHRPGFSLWIMQAVRRIKLNARHGGMAFHRNAGNR